MGITSRYGLSMVASYRGDGSAALRQRARKELSEGSCGTSTSQLASWGPKSSVLDNRPIHDQHCFQKWARRILQVASPFSILHAHIIVALSFLEPSTTRRRPDSP